MKIRDLLLVAASALALTACAADVEPSDRLSLPPDLGPIVPTESYVEPADCSGMTGTAAYQCACMGAEGMWARSTCVLTEPREVPRSVVRKGQSPTVWVTLADRLEDEERKSDPLCAAATGSGCDPCVCAPHPTPAK